MSSTSQDRKSRLTVYTIEECPVCAQKTKRPFQVGDYVTKDGGKCPKDGNTMRITMIYAEAPPKA